MITNVRIIVILINYSVNNFIIIIIIIIIIISTSSSSIPGGAKKTSWTFACVIQPSGQNE